jgi:predicted tellurium resistance membrane protein TerC
MVLAVVISVVIMMFAVGKVSRFVDSHPTIKMLALSFLLLIGTTLVAEGVEVHFPKGYIYFAMAFSIFVETLNLRMRKNSEPVELHKSYPQ